MMAWLPKKCIVVPIDFSDASIAALDVARGLAEDGRSLHAIHVLGEFSPAEPHEVWNAIDRQQRARHARQALRERLAAPEYAAMQIEVAFGDPGNEIAAFAERIAADLIVLPSHGRTGARRLLIGSVAERVVRLAHCPVLVLRR